MEDPKGLPDSGVVIKSVFNTNGFTIDEIESTVGTAITCTLVTPSLGFSTSPFKVGDEIDCVIDYQSNQRNNYHPILTIHECENELEPHSQNIDYGNHRIE